MSNLKASTIKLNGKGFLPKGSASTAGLPIILHALQLTVLNESAMQYVIPQTDLASVELLFKAIDCNELWVRDSVSGVGMLMAQADMDNVDADSLQNIGYLLNGLMHLQAQLSEARHVLQNTQVYLSQDKGSSAVQSRKGERS